MKTKNVWILSFVIALIISTVGVYATTALSEQSDSALLVELQVENQTEVENEPETFFHVHTVALDFERPVMCAIHQADNFVYNLVYKVLKPPRLL